MDSRVSVFVVVFVSLVIAVGLHSLENVEEPLQNISLNSSCGGKGGECCGGCDDGLECVNGTCMVRVVMFHNNQGPMCLKQLDFLEEYEKTHPYIVLEEHLTTNAEEVSLLGSKKIEYGESEGVSKNFGFLPVTFVGNQAFSGFDENVEDRLREVL